MCLCLVCWDGELGLVIAVQICRQREWSAIATQRGSRHHTSVQVSVEVGHSGGGYEEMEDGAREAAQWAESPTPRTLPR